MELLRKIFGGAKRPGRDTGLGRNEPCWCGSGKKYKRCHWDKDREWLQGQSRSCTSS